MHPQHTNQLRSFAREKHLIGLSMSTLEAVAKKQTGYTLKQAYQFLHFQRRIEQELLSHRIITTNPYTRWFRDGRMSLGQVQAFVVQFSVFSNQFLCAQLLKTINADSLDGMRASKEILANEIGVVFNPGPGKSGMADRGVASDPEIVSTQGSVDGGVFYFRAAHFEWLLGVSAKLGLGFNEVGKRRHGTPATLHFCEELMRLYGNEDYMTSQAASYAVENWAAAGFWKELIEGLRSFRRRRRIVLPLAFFTWHDRLEAQHAKHTQEELEELYFMRPVDEDRFISDGTEMLDGVACFWDGLDEQRKHMEDYH